MDRQIKRLGIALVVCFCMLFVQLNYIQFFAAERIREEPGNERPETRDFARPRGQILAADGSVLAFSVEERSRFKYRRVYPQGDLFGPITGYFSGVLGRTGVERSYGEELAGTIPELRFANLSDLFEDRENVGNVHLTVRPDVQQVARDALGEQEGSVVALDPRTGAIDAMWSFPTFDPNPLSDNSQDATDLKTVLDADPEKPLLFRAYRDIFAPGSTFKVVTATDGGGGRPGHRHRALVPRPLRVRRGLHRPRPEQLRAATPAAATCSRSSGCRATRRSPRWASTWARRP